MINIESTISPVWFYLINVVDNLSLLSTIILLFSCGTTILISFVMFLAWVSEDLEEQDISKYLKYLKIALKIIIPCVVVVFLTPSSDTIYKMIVADNITSRNIEVVGNTIEDSIDYIFEKNNSLTLEEEVKE